ncbi:hypothetical protein [uncultured Streptomyces sp.]|uniref:hypothetical protein n=1 Tax=uncultured Streptomyces sp. TaxID=174707 RepID=UPI00262F7B57|nr:hypothetical protein [uncultured Streptomyces sp.]
MTTHRDRTTRPGTRTLLALVATAAGAATLLAGCGIRTMSVPVDGGAAPSRVPCRTSAAGSGSTEAGSALVHVYLLCASELVTVDRTVPVLPGDRLGTARQLLDQSRRSPLTEERRAGFTTAVPSDLGVEGARADDPAGTLRLSEQPEDLAQEALAQLVCTFAEDAALATGGTVLLGGPGRYAPRGYACTAQTKARPQELATPDPVAPD